MGQIVPIVGLTLAVLAVAVLVARLFWPSNPVLPKADNNWLQRSGKEMPSLKSAPDDLYDSRMTALGIDIDTGTQD